MDWGGADFRGANPYLPAATPPPHPARTDPYWQRGEAKHPSSSHPPSLAAAAAPAPLEVVVTPKAKTAPFKVGLPIVIGVLVAVILALVVVFVFRELNRKPKPPVAAPQRSGDEQPGFLRANRNQFVNLGQRAANGVWPLELRDTAQTVWVRTWVAGGGGVFTLRTVPAGGGVLAGIVRSAPQAVVSVSGELVQFQPNGSSIAASGSDRFLSVGEDATTLFWSDSPGHQLSEITFLPLPANRLPAAPSFLPPSSPPPPALVLPNDPSFDSAAAMGDRSFLGSGESFVSAAPGDQSFYDPGASFIDSQQSRHVNFQQQPQLHHEW